MLALLCCNHRSDHSHFHHSSNSSTHPVSLRHASSLSITSSGQNSNMPSKSPSLMTCITRCSMLPGSCTAPALNCWWVWKSGSSGSCCHRSSLLLSQALATCLRDTCEGLRTTAGQSSNALADGRASVVPRLMVCCCRHGTIMSDSISVWHPSISNAVIRLEPGRRKRPRPDVNSVAGQQTHPENTYYAVENLHNGSGPRRVSPQNPTPFRRSPERAPSKYTQNVALPANMITQASNLCTPENHSLGLVMSLSAAAQLQWCSCWGG